MSRAAIAALLGVGGALMIMKGVAGDRSLSETWEAYTGGKKRGDKVTEEFKGLSKEDWIERQQNLRALGFRAPTEGVYNEGMVRAVKDFEREHGLEVDGEWDDEVEEALAEEIEYLEKNGVPKWFHNRIDQHGYESLEDFELSGQGRIGSSDRVTGKAYLEDPAIGKFDTASLELASKYEPYWELSDFPPLPGPQFMTWDEDRQKLVLGPDHLYAQAHAITDMIEVVKDRKGFRDIPREWLDQYNQRWEDSPYWKQGALNYGALIALGPLYVPTLIGEQVLWHWYSNEFDVASKSQAVYFEAIMKGIYAGAMVSRLMFADGRQIAIKDWKANSESKQAAIADYSMLLNGVIGELVAIYKTHSSFTAAQLDGAVRSKVDRWSRAKNKSHIIVLEER